jgi:hypothetical protein
MLRLGRKIFESTPNADPVRFDNKGDLTVRESPKIFM